MTCIPCFLRVLLFEDATRTMHPLFAKADRHSGEVIGAAILTRRSRNPKNRGTEPLPTKRTVTRPFLRSPAPSGDSECGTEQ